MGIVTVPQDRAYLIERSGKYRRTLLHGVHFLIPFVDRIAYVYSLQHEYSFSISVPWRCTNFGNMDLPVFVVAGRVPVFVDALVYVKVRYGDAYYGCFEGVMRDCPFFELERLFSFGFVGFQVVDPHRVSYVYSDPIGAAKIQAYSTMKTVINVMKLSTVLKKKDKLKEAFVVSLIFLFFLQNSV